MDSIVDRALSEVRQKKEKEMQRIKRLEKNHPDCFYGNHCLEKIKIRKQMH